MLSVYEIGVDYDFVRVLLPVDVNRTCGTYIEAINLMKTQRLYTLLCKQRLSACQLNSHLKNIKCIVVITYSINLNLSYFILFYFILLRMQKAGIGLLL